MSPLCRRLLSDYRRARPPTSTLFPYTTLFRSIIPGLVALRNATISALGTIGNTLLTLVPSLTFFGYLISGDTGTPVSAVQGGQVNVNSNQYLSGSQLAPVQFGTVHVIPPSP